MKTISIIILVAIIALPATDCDAVQTETLHCVSNALDTLKSQIGSRSLRAIEKESLNFELGLSKTAMYRDFSEVVTNDWRNIVTNINFITTNYVDKILIFGTGKQGDDNLYLAYYATLAEMKINNAITQDDIETFAAPTRYELQSVLIRRYQEPSVSNLVEQLKIARPSLSNHWNSILSGECYQKYLIEAQDGLWGDNPLQ